MSLYLCCCSRFIHFLCNASWQSLNEDFWFMLCNEMEHKIFISALRVKKKKKLPHTTPLNGQFFCMAIMLECTYPTFNGKFH